MNFDAIDKKLLKLLQTDSKQTTKELSMKLNLSVTAVYERIKKLEKEGFEFVKQVPAPEGLIGWVGHESRCT